MIFDGEKERRAVNEAFDYVIVGSGAAGAAAAGFTWIVEQGHKRY